MRKTACRFGYGSDTTNISKYLAKYYLAKYIAKYLAMVLTLYMYKYSDYEKWLQSRGLFEDCGHKLRYVNQHWKNRTCGGSHGYSSSALDKKSRTATFSCWTITFECPVAPWATTFLGNFADPAECSASLTNVYNTIRKKQTWPPFIPRNFLATFLQFIGIDI